MSGFENTSPVEPQIPVDLLQAFIDAQKRNMDLMLELVDGTNQEVDLAFLREETREECLMELAFILMDDGVPIEWEYEEGDKPPITTEFDLDTLTDAIKYFGTKTLMLSGKYKYARRTNSPSVREDHARAMETRAFLMDLARDIESHGYDTGLKASQT